MTKRKTRKSSSKSTKTGPARKPDVLAGARAIEALMTAFGEASQDDAVSQAQEIMYDAWEADDHRRRIELARKALKISPLCADAYVLLAQETVKTADEAIALYRQGVEAGEEALGKAAFDEDVGHFWGLIETRPYMRARQGLAFSLWEKGLQDEAVGHYREMLRLNPNDNQGIRYLLLDCLLALGDDDEAVRLIELYEGDGAAAWMWSQALLSFRRSGDCAESSKALAAAVEANAHVPAYLLGRKNMPRQLPAFISWGGEDEAIAYVDGAAEAWAAVPAALAWVEAAHTAAGGRKKASSAREAPGEEADIDPDRVDEAVLALLRLGLHAHGRVWKTFDWEAMNRLHEKGLISNPVGKAKSVELTEEGAARSERLLRDLFGRR